jgi:hypothetical protein
VFVVVAERVRDDWCWCLDDELARAAVRVAAAGTPRSWISASRVFGWRGCPARLPGNSQLLLGLAAVFVFCGLAASWRMGEARRPWDRYRWFAQPEEDLVCVVDDVVGGESDYAAGGLGVEQHQAGRDPRSCGRPFVGQETAKQGQPRLRKLDKSVRIWQIITGSCRKTDVAVRLTSTDTT